MDSLPEVLLFVWVAESPYFCHLVHTLRWDPISCCWSGGDPEESRGKQIPLDEVCQQHIHGGWIIHLENWLAVVKVKKKSALIQAIKDEHNFVLFGIEKWHVF